MRKAPAGEIEVRLSADRRAARGRTDATPHEGKAEGRQYREPDGVREARPVAPALSRPPEGQARWTPRPLPERPVEREAVARPPDGKRPVACVDGGGERPIGDIRPPPPARPGGAAKGDGEYEPLGGKRLVEVTEGRTAVDLARSPERLLDERYPDAGRVVPVTDDPNTHGVASPCEAFEPAEARRLAGRVEWHYTPKHGPRPTMAECEPSAPARQCLDRRMTDRVALAREVAAWQAGRDAAAVRTDWQFTTADARTELKRLFPVIVATIQPQ